MAIPINQAKSLRVYRGSMSNVLWLPLVAGMLDSAYIAWRTVGRVRIRGIIAFVAVGALFSLVYVPELVGGWVALGLRISDFVAYVLGEGWLSVVWLAAMVLTAIRRFTKTRIWESERVALVLDGVVVLGFAWIFWSFITGHPMKAFG